MDADPAQAPCRLQVRAPSCASTAGHPSLSNQGKQIDVAFLRLPLLRGHPEIFLLPTDGRQGR